MFDLTLQNGYPSPYPEGLTDEESDEIADNVTSLDIVGVVAFQWLHTITIEFADQASYDAAKALTGWTPWSPLVLEAQSSAAEGYAHPAILAGDKAYCGFMLTLAEPAEAEEPAPTPAPVIEVLIDVNEYKRRANAHGQERWFLPDMLDDVFEADRQIAEAIAAGETPEEFIDKIAADLDLHDFSN